MPRIACFCLYLLLVATGSPVWAQSHTYIGPSEECVSELGQQANAWQCPFNWSAGTEPGPGSTVLINAADVEGVFSSASVTGLILEGGTDLRTAGSLLVNDAFVWNGGDLETNGTVSVAGMATLGGVGKILRATDFQIEGTAVVTWTSGLLQIETGTINNRGTFDAQADNVMVFQTSGTAPGFINRNTGRLVRKGGTATATFNTGFLNEGGLIDVAQGTLRFETSASRTLHFEGGTYDAGPDGTLILRNAVLTGTLMGAPTGFVGTENGSMVEIDGTATLDFDGTGFQWAGGFVSDGTLTNAGLLRLTGLNRDLENATLRNEGTLRREAASTRMRSATIENTGLFEIQGDGQILLQQSGTNAFVNATGGTLLRSSGATPASINIPVTNASGATIDLAVGTFEFRDLLDLLEGSRLQGNGTYDRTSSGSATVAGVVAPGTSPGILTWENDDFNPFAPTTSAVLEIELGGPAAGTEYDQFAVAGAVELGGTLRILLTDGFTPEEGDRFLIIPTPSAVSGSFDALDLPDGTSATVEAVAEGVELVIGAPTVGEDGTPSAPTALALQAPYPNPFSDRLTLRYEIPRPGPVTVAVYDARGRRVAVLADGERATGRYEAVIDGRTWPNGLYVVRLTAGGDVRTQRVTLLR